jgi:hypothetical protein
MSQSPAHLARSIWDYTSSRMARYNYNYKNPNKRSICCGGNSIAVNYILLIWKFQAAAYPTSWLRSTTMLEKRLPWCPRRLFISHLRLALPLRTLRSAHAVSMLNSCKELHVSLNCKITVQDSSSLTKGLHRNVDIEMHILISMHDEFLVLIPAMIHIFRITWNDSVVSSSHKDIKDVLQNHSATSTSLDSEFT